MFLTFHQAQLLVVSLHLKALNHINSLDLGPPKNEPWASH
jgi:hypothetical protein